jgi:hypothetical protein
MTCIVCGKTLANVEQFPLSIAAQKMVKKQLGIDRKAPSASGRVCSECSIQSQARQD